MSMLDDAVVIPLPVDTDRVIEALARLRGLPMLTGGRGQQAPSHRSLLDVQRRVRVSAPVAVSSIKR
jgi:hypothetical protein